MRAPPIPAFVRAAEEEARTKTEDAEALRRQSAARERAAMWSERLNTATASLDMLAVMQARTAMLRCHYDCLDREQAEKTAWALRSLFDTFLVKGDTARLRPAYEACVALRQCGFDDVASLVVEAIRSAGEAEGADELATWIKDADEPENVPEPAAVLSAKDRRREAVRLLHQAAALLDEE